jgi:hypothetical protein
MSNYEKCITSTKLLDSGKLSASGKKAFISQVVNVLKSGIDGSIGSFPLPIGPTCPTTGESVFKFKGDSNADALVESLNSKDSQWSKTWPDVLGKILSTIDIPGCTPFMSTFVFDPTGLFPTTKLPKQSTVADLLSALLDGAGITPADPTGLTVKLPAALLKAGMSASPPIPPIPPIPIPPVIPGFPMTPPIPPVPPGTQIPVIIPVPLAPIIPGKPVIPDVPFIVNALDVMNFSMTLIPIKIVTGMLSDLLSPAGAAKLINPVALPLTIFELVIKSLMSAVGSAVGFDMSGQTIALIPKTLIATVLVIAKYIAVCVASCLVSQIIGTGSISGNLISSFGLI